MQNKILINILPKYLKPVAKFIRHKEQPSGLSTTRFIQDFSVCMIPKATFSRSIADLSENIFLEGSEESLIYFTPGLIGEHVSRKIFSKNLPQNLKDSVSIKGSELLDKAIDNKQLKEDNKQILPVKAAIALTAMIIPLTEYSLNYIKNLLTLKIFKKSDFKNIASLEKNQENKIQQEKVRRSAKRHIGFAAACYSLCLGLAALIGTKGKNSKILQEISKLIVAPGTKLFGKYPKIKNFVNKYFCMDFNSENGKLVMSKGQLTTCVLVGGCGYFGASADRGKENLKETATRFPIVGLYVITGSELVENGLKKLLYKLGKCKDLIDKNLKTPDFNELEDLAYKLSKSKKTSVQKEYKSLVKQKCLISGLPFVFSIGVMGFFVSGITNYFTRKRYEKAKINTKNLDTNASK